MGAKDRCLSPIEHEINHYDSDKKLKDLYYQLLCSKPISICQLANRKPSIIVSRKGLPDTGTRPDGSDFFQDALELKALNERSMTVIKSDHPDYWNELGGGDPMKLSPFPGLSDTIVRLFNSDRLSQYPTTEGDYEIRRKIVGYLKQEKFSHKLTESNIAFSVSTTHAIYCALLFYVRLMLFCSNLLLMDCLPSPLSE